MAKLNKIEIIKMLQRTDQEFAEVKNHVRYLPDGDLLRLIDDIVVMSHSENLNESIIGALAANMLGNALVEVSKESKQ